MIKYFISDRGHSHKNNSSRIAYHIDKLKKIIYFNQRNEGGMELWVTSTAPTNT